jgi:hypothetical protein
MLRTWRLQQLFCSAQRFDERAERKMENAADFVLGK